jgi:hypothetical protein
MTYGEFQEAMIAYAKEFEDRNYAGDDYYLQDCWREHWEDGDKPEDCVDSDMSYWD